MSGELDAYAVLVRPEVGRPGHPGVAAPPESSAATAASGLSRAPVQCSTRRWIPAAGSYQEAQSPTATTPATLVRPSAPHLTPSSRTTPLLGQPFDARAGTHADDDGVGRDAAAVLEQDRLDASLPAQSLDPDAAQQAYAVVRMERGDDASHDLAERSGKRSRRGLDDRHVKSQAVRGRGDLGADEPAADHHQPPAEGQIGPQGPGVVQGPQRVHSFEALAARQHARGRTRGDDDPVGPDGPAVGKPHGVVGGVESRGPHAEQPLRLQVLAVRLQSEIRFADRAGEELLGQRRPVVRAVRLVTDHDEPSVVALLAQGACGRQSGERGADHGHGPHAGPPASRAAMQGGRFGAAVDGWT